MSYLYRVHARTRKSEWDETALMLELSASIFRVVARTEYNRMSQIIQLRKIPDITGERMVTGFILIPDLSMNQIVRLGSERAGEGPSTDAMPSVSRWR